jgi:hypothetical protein
MNIEESKEDKGVEQRSIDAQAIEKDIEEEEVYEAGVQPSIEV